MIYMQFNVNFIQRQFILSFACKDFIKIGSYLQNSNFISGNKRYNLINF